MVYSKSKAQSVLGSEILDQQLPKKLKTNYMVKKSIQKLTFICMQNQHFFVQQRMVQEGLYHSSCHILCCLHFLKDLPDHVIANVHFAHQFWVQNVLYTPEITPLLGWRKLTPLSSLAFLLYLFPAPQQKLQPVPNFFSKCYFLPSYRVSRNCQARSTTGIPSFSLF